MPRKPKPPRNLVLKKRKLLLLLLPLLLLLCSALCVVCDELAGNVPTLEPASIVCPFGTPHPRPFSPASRDLSTPTEDLRPSLNGY